MAKTRYTVLNPRGIPSHVHIIRVDERKWNEGDTFVQPKGLSSEEVDGLVAGGFLEEVNSDG